MRQFLIISLWFGPILLGQGPIRTRYIPALAYGPNAWSIVRLTNSGAQKQSVQLEVYREDGTPMPMAPMVEVSPGTSMDVRIERKSAELEMCWARVVLPDGVNARGYVEVLEGNSLEDFPRELHGLSDEPRWVTLSSRVQGKQMYFLNGGTEPTTVSFCAVNQAPLNVCEKKGTRAARYRVGPNQSLSVEVRKLRGKFFITESSMPGAAILALFDNGPGTKKVFGSNSSIEFGEPRQ